MSLTTLQSPPVRYAPGDGAFGPLARGRVSSRTRSDRRSSRRSAGFQPETLASTPPAVFEPASQATPSIKEKLDDTERDALFQSFQPLIRRLTAFYNWDREMQQDLQGEIYCRFCHLLDQYDPSRGIPRPAYLTHTLRMSIYTFTRSYRRTRQREVSLETVIETGQPIDLAAPDRDWDQDLLVEQISAQLPEAIQKVPLRQRQVLIYRFYESLSFEEIADRLGICTATARSLLRYGIKHLRKQLSDTPLFAE